MSGYLDTVMYVACHARSKLSAVAFCMQYRPTCVILTNKLLSTVKYKILYCKVRYLHMLNVSSQGRVEVRLKS